ncbi:hypothetical protein BO78DRAFT_69863 [Aspergillus sclerotiicarbonarius CBS 121057]|uniref:Uncharacterized protein n=1 Tax=Aspergillus sclerotiicarbonarius (strain CBS 121057 / IBT 28362) TaxID=1448318 RepID=A0A319EP83_ASPSB|nr:hypothetical protein BO78DRAFT_69863 [Aspergillus sclerotiicarbonarius CBS 121057]
MDRLRLNHRANTVRGAANKSVAPDGGSVMHAVPAQQEWRLTLPPLFLVASLLRPDTERQVRKASRCPPFLPDHQDQSCFSFCRRLLGSDRGLLCFALLCFRVVLGRSRALVRLYCVLGCYLLLLVRGRYSPI